MIAETAAKIIAYVRSRGSDAKTLRDAAHEAHHALTTRAKKWDRASIDAAVKRSWRDYSMRVVDEINARAVEQIVCADLGVVIDGPKKWAFVTCMESMQIDRVNIGDLSVVEAAIVRRMAHPRVRRDADAVLALAAKSLPVRKARRAMEIAP